MKPCPKVRVRGGALLLAALTLSAASDDTADPAEEPRKIGLVERAERGLAQLDVSVRGPWEAISDLTVEDFELVINGQLIEGVIVDRLCSQPDPSEKASKRAAAEPPAPAVEAGPASLPDRLPASFLFYFDQQLMSGAGRQNSIDLTREMIPKLIRDGNRAAIVSSGRRLATLADLTDDVDVLLETLDRLERDREQWVAYPQEEDFRIREVLETLENLGIYSACGTCKFCRNGDENLCPSFRATGRDADGGYAEYMTVPENFAHAIPEQFSDSEAAPLLCAGAIGYRSLRLSNLEDGGRLGLTGFGASAHIVLKMVRHRYPNSHVYVFARSEEERETCLCAQVFKDFLS